MTNDLDMRALLRLLAVVEAGSFAQAARALGVSRQAVHRSVEALEEAAGGPLLDRSARALRPTTLGRRLLGHAAALREVERSLRETLDQGRDAPSGTLKITAPPLFAETVLALATARFVARWPSVRVVVSANGGRTRLLRDDHDVMIRVGAPPDAHFASKLGDAERVLCAAPHHLDALGAPRQPSDLSGRALLEFGRASAAWTFVHDGDERAVAVQPRVTSDASGVVVRACLAGAGILRCPALAVRPLLSSGRLVRVLPAWSIPRADVWAIYGHRTADDPTLRAFMEELRAAFADEAAA